MIQYIMGGAALGGSLLSMYGSYQSSKEEERIAKYNAKVAKMQGIAEAKAIQAQNRIQIEVDRENMSTLENQMANRGIAADVGSPLLLASKVFSDMVADRNEMNRQAEIARLTGQAQSTMYGRQAAGIASARRISLLSQGISMIGGAVGTYKDYGGTFGKKSTTTV